MFKNVEYGEKCDLGKLKMLDNQIFMGGKIFIRFRKACTSLNFSEICISQSVWFMCQTKISSSCIEGFC